MHSHMYRYARLSIGMDAKKHFYIIDISLLLLLCLLYPAGAPL